MARVEPGASAGIVGLGRLRQPVQPISPYIQAVVFPQEFIAEVAVRQLQFPRIRLANDAEKFPRPGTTAVHKSNVGINLHLLKTAWFRPGWRSAHPDRPCEMR